MKIKRTEHEVNKTFVLLNANLQCKHAHSQAHIDKHPQPQPHLDSDGWDTGWHCGGVDKNDKIALPTIA